MTGNVEPLSSILVGVDLSKASDPLIDFASCLAKKFGSEIILFYAVDENLIEHAAAGFDPVSLIDYYVGKAKDYLASKTEELASKGIRARYRIWDTPADPAVAIYRAALEEGASEILVGHKGRRLFKIIPIGSTALTLVHITSLPLFLVKPYRLGDSEEVKIYIREHTLQRDVFVKPVIAIDKYSSESMLEYFAKILKKDINNIINIYIVHVVESGEDEVEAKKLLSKSKKIFEENGLKVNTVLLEGKPSKTIASFVEQIGATILMAGRTARKKRNIIEHILGTTLWRLIVSVDIPILIYPLETANSNV